MFDVIIFNRQYEVLAPSTVCRSAQHIPNDATLSRLAPVSFYTNARLIAVHDCFRAVSLRVVRDPGDGAAGRLRPAGAAGAFEAARVGRTRHDHRQRTCEHVAHLPQLSHAGATRPTSLGRSAANTCPTGHLQEYETHSCHCRQCKLLSKI